MVRLAVIPAALTTLEASHTYCAVSEGLIGLIGRVLEISLVPDIISFDCPSGSSVRLPLISLYHWMVGLGLPVALQENMASIGCVTVCSRGERSVTVGATETKKAGYLHMIFGAHLHNTVSTHELTLYNEFKLTIITSHAVGGITYVGA